MSINTWKLDIFALSKLQNKMVLSCFPPKSRILYF